MIVKQIYKIVVILGLLISLILSTSMYATESATYETLKVQAQVMSFGQGDTNLQTEWVKVEILKDDQENSVYQEFFNNYLIEEGWLQVELGTQSDNKLNVGILNAEKNWIKITIKEGTNIAPAIIITMNAVANALFAKVAQETPTGNLLGSLENNEGNVLIVNDAGDKFEYIPPSNLLERITTNSIFEALNLSEVAVEGTIPELGAHVAHKYLQLDESGTQFKIVNKLASVSDEELREELRSTSNLFVGQGSQEKSIFLWNSDLERFEAQPTVNLGFEAVDNQIKAEVAQNKLERESEDTSIRSDFWEADNELQIIIDQNKQERETKDNEIISEFGATDIVLEQQINQNKMDRDTKDAAILVSINQVISDYETADLAILNQVQYEMLEMAETVSSNTLSIGELNTAYQVADDVIQVDVDQNEADSNSADATLQANIDTLSSAIESLDAAYQVADTEIQADVDQNKLDSDSEDAAIRLEFTSALSESESNVQATIEALQNDVNQNEADSDSEDAAIRSEFTSALSESESNVQATIEALQNDVNQNEADSNSADVTLQGNIDTLSSAIENLDEAYQVADTEIQANIDQNKLDSDSEDAAIRLELTSALSESESNVQATIVALQNDVNQNEVDSDSADTILQGNIDTLSSTVENIDAAYQAADTSIIASFNIVLQGNEDAINQNFQEQLTQIDTAYQTADTVLETAYQAADAIIQADVDVNEAARIAEDANIRSELAEADAIIQADIDQNEADSDSADTAIRSEFAGADADLSDNLTTAYQAADAVLSDSLTTAYQTADSAIQADVNQNEADSDSADAILQGNIDTLSSTVENIDAAYQAADTSIIASFNILLQGNEDAINQNFQEQLTQIDTAYQTADAIIQDDVDVNEAARIAEDANIRSELAEADAIIQADINQNEADSDSEDTAIRSEFAAADAVLSDSLTTAYQAADAVLSDSLTTAYQAADAVLSDSLTAAYQTADAAIQADVDQNEADSDSEDTAIRSEFAGADTALSDSLTTAYQAADAAIQADIDQNEADSDSTDTAIRSEFVAADATQTNEITATFTAADTALQANIDSIATDLLGAQTAFGGMLAELQADVDQNEADSDSENAAIRDEFADNTALSDSLTAAYQTADAAIQADVDQNEADSDSEDTAIRSEFAGADADLSDNLTTAYQAADAAIQADINQNEADSDSEDTAIRSEFVAADAIQTNEITATFTAADTALQENIDSIETDMLSAETAFGEMLADLQADVDQNEADSDGHDHGNMYINSVGSNGQVWKSDGSGRGYWGTDNNTVFNHPDSNHSSHTNHSHQDEDSNTTFLRGDGSWAIPPGNHEHDFAAPHNHDYSGTNHNHGSWTFGSGHEFKWNANSDQGYIRFDSTGDGGGQSYLTIGTRDNHDEEIRFKMGNYDVGKFNTSRHFYVNNNLQVGGTIYGNGSGLTNISGSSHSHGSESNNYIGNSVNTWQRSSDNPNHQDRFYFANNSVTILKSGHNGNNLFEWWNLSDVTKMKLNEHGQIWTANYGWLHDKFIGRDRDVWQSSSEGRPRFYFARQSTTYFRSGHNNDNLFTFRNWGDADKVRIKGDGTIWTSGGLHIGHDDPGGGSGDTALIRYVAIGGETTALEYRVMNDNDDGHRFYTQNNLRLLINSRHGGNYASYEGNSNWSFNSDRRIKKDIKKEENILNRLMNLDVVNYNYRWTDNSKFKEIGLIAQDVKPYFPELVSKGEASTDAKENGLDEVYRLGYTTFGVLAIGGIKELKLEKDENIASLNNKINQLNAENKVLKNTLESLLKRVEELEERK